MESCSPRLCIDLNICKYKWLVFGCPAVIYDIQGEYSWLVFGCPAVMSNIHCTDCLIAMSLLI